MLPPNPKWSQLEVFSVASLVSTLFAVPVCSKLVHWNPKVMFHFTQNFIHNWTNWVQLLKTIKSGLKFSKIKQWLYLRFPCIYEDLVKTYNVMMQQYNIHRRIGNNSKCFVVWFPIKNISKIHTSRKISLSVNFYTYIVKRMSKPSRSIINRNLFISSLTSNAAWHEK